LAGVVTSFRLGTARSLISLCFKSQRSLSLRNDFNPQRLETARIATLSQQLLRKGPDQDFPVIALPPPPWLDGGGGACGATSRLETRPQYVFVCSGLGR
jgi:hypothetical protein